ncbi:LCP family protein [Desulfosporosinus sp. PR]|uniref:LCP family protein n=1 Tax=Candidatus Desulfosporosinus nitrosoreducens TaxID=3401928 RepID=UPI0027ED94A5|nr:LCP family protein [Desulfosporosinus sp. PR]MDQ7093607.1 LCP family protein [Desulfosporosinus sp. PR]
MKNNGNKSKYAMRLIYSAVVIVFLGLYMSHISLVKSKSPLLNGYKSFQSAKSDEETNSTTADQNQNSLQDSAKQETPQQLTILLLGVDRRPGEKSLGNTDTIIVVQLNKDKKRISVLSIPRDTQVEVSGFGTQKINAVARLEAGPKATVTKLETLLGCKIDGYVVTNFNEFKTIVDDLGGVTIDVDKNMHYVTGDEHDGVINLQKGIQHLNGDQALQYVRFRRDQLGDIQRTMRQQELLKSLANQCCQIQALPKLPLLIAELYKCIDTDLSLGQTFELADVLVQIKNAKIVSETLPGNFSIENGISYWKVKPAVCSDAAYKLFSNGVTEPVLVEVDNKGIQSQNRGTYKKQNKTNTVSTNQSADLNAQKTNVDFEIIVNN